LKNSRLLVKQNRRKHESRIQVPQSSELFIGVPRSAATNPNFSPFVIHG
jgi:hypothetical protein